MFELIKIYEKSTLALVNEIDRLQLDSYNQDSLYNSFSNWNVYASSSKFKPQIAIYTEIVSNGKLKLINDNNLKSQLLKVYTNSYPELEYFQKKTAETIRNTSVAELSRTFRWLLAVNNDGLETTSVQLKNPMVQLNDDWIKNKQSEGFILLENQLALRHASYSGSIRVSKRTSNEIELLETEISRVLKKNKE